MDENATETNTNDTGTQPVADIALPARDEKLENLENKPKWGGVRPNSGRPKGGQNKATLEKKIVEEELRQRILNNAQRLIDAQFSLSQGVSYLYRIDKDEKGKREKPVLVVDPDEIAEFLDGEYGDGESANDESSYYYITAERPNNMSIDSLLDRTFGKAPQSMDVTSGGEKVENITKINYIIPDGSNSTPNEKTERSVSGAE